MKELIFWLIEKLVGKDLMHLKMNVQIGALVLLAVCVSALTAFLIRVNYRWNAMEEASHSLPMVVSNEMAQAESQRMRGETEIIHKLNQIQSTTARNTKDIQGIKGFIEGKYGINLDYGAPSGLNLNMAVFDPTNTISND
jgi:hypothetical protein